MSLWKIAWRSIQQRGLSSFLTGLSMALGVTLMVAILSAGKTVQSAYETGPTLNHDLVVGPRGSSLALVLNTEFHIDKTLPSALPWSYYREFLNKTQRGDDVDGKFANWVEMAVPICKGDNYEGFHVVGTTPQFFASPPNTANPLFYLADGQIFTDQDYYTAVIGATVARETGLKVGETFKPTHGVEPTGADQHQHDPIKVVGILSATGTPNDRAIFMNLDGFLMLHHEEEPEPSLDAAESNKTAAAAATGEKPHGGHGHDHAHDHHHPLPDSEKSVSAILVLSKTIKTIDEKTKEVREIQGMTGNWLASAINKSNEAQAAFPHLVTLEFSQKFVQPLVTVLGVLTSLIVVASAVSILVSIYNSMNERRRDIAVMRALGAGQQTVMLMMFVETILLALLGGLVGWVAGHLLVGLAGPWLTPRTGISFNPWLFSPWEAILIPGLILLAGIVGYLPAMSAYRTDVAKALTASP